jgi:hypothetical protein
MPPRPGLAATADRARTVTGKACNPVKRARGRVEPPRACLGSDRLARRAAAFISRPRIAACPRSGPGRAAAPGPDRGSGRRGLRRATRRWPGGGRLPGPYPGAVSLGAILSISPRVSAVPMMAWRGCRTAMRGASLALKRRRRRRPPAGEPGGAGRRRRGRAGIARADGSRHPPRRCAGSGPGGIGRAAFPPGRRWRTAASPAGAGTSCRALYGMPSAFSTVTATDRESKMFSSCGVPEIGP